MTPRRTTSVGLLAALIAAFSAAPLVAQEIKVGSGRAANRPALQSGADLSSMRNGDKPINPKTMDEMAQWLVYRLTWEGFRDVDKGRSNENFNTLIDEVRRHIIIPGTSSAGGSWPVKLEEKHRKYVDAFGEAMDRRLNDVLKSPEQPIVAINAARMLAESCKSGYAGHADTIIALLNDPKRHDAIKLHACQAARNLLNAPGYFTLRNHTIRDNFKLDALIQALTRYAIHDFTAAPAGADPMDTAVAQFIRREAVRALSASRFAVIQPDPAVSKLTAFPAFTLLQVVTSDAAVQPRASASERVEAIVGLCQIPVDSNLELILNLDYASFYVGATMLDLVRLHNSGDKSIPWKVTAARLTAALNGWRDSARKAKHPDTDRLATLAEAVVPNILEPIEKEGLTAKPNDQPLQAWGQQNNDAMKKKGLVARAEAQTALKFAQPR